MWENVHFYACSLVSLDFILLAANLRVTIGLRPPPTAPYPPPTPQDRRKTPQKSSRPAQRRSGRTPRPSRNCPRTSEEHRMCPKIPQGSEIGAPTPWEQLALRPFLHVGYAPRPHRRGLDAVTSVWASNIFETKPGSFVGAVCMAFNVKKHGDMALASPSMEKLLSPSIPAPVFNDASSCKQYGYHRRCFEVDTDIEKGAWAAWLLGGSSAS